MRPGDRNEVLNESPGMPSRPTGSRHDLTYHQALAAHQAGRLDTAIALFEAALAASPRDAATLHAAALAYRDRGDLSRAIGYLERALKSDPRDMTARHNLGGLYFAAQRFDDARSAFEAVVAQRPDWALALRNLGATLVAQGFPSEALQAFGRALQITRDDPWVHYHVGRAGTKLGDPQLGIAAFEEALKLDPKNFGFATALAELCVETGHYARGEDAYKHALMLQPTHLPTILAVADRLAKSGRADEALILIQHARELAPEEPGPLVILARAHRQLGAPEEAERLCHQLLSDYPAAPDVLFLLGLLALESGRLELARRYFGEILAADEQHGDAGINDAYVTLMEGDFSEGWLKFERRLTHPTLRYFHHRGPRWTGEPLAGLTLLIESEQGFGDTLQFVRYVPLVAQEAGRILLRVPPQMHRLLGNLPKNVELLAWEARVTDFDRRIELMSLPLRLGTTFETIPAPIPYLGVDQTLVASWRAYLGVGEPCLRVGLVWAGNPDHQNDCNRSMPVECLLPLTRTEGIKFYSLQVGPRAADLARMPTGAIDDLSSRLSDFADTAAALVALDLLIAVDTSVVHLAGALGRPVWLLLSTTSEWRWLRDRDTSPWYPTMKIFRQTAYRDWATVISRVAIELETLACSASEPS